MKMTKTVTTVLAVLICCSGLVLSRLHQTTDSIISEAAVEGQATGRTETYPSTAGRSWLVPLLRLPASWDSAVLKKAIEPHSPLSPASTYLMAEKSSPCWTPEGRDGVCRPALSCHHPPSGILASGHACRYDNDGKEEVGVCCPRAPVHLGGTMAWLYPPFLLPISLHHIATASLSAPWPWWDPLTPLTAASSPASATVSPGMTTHGLSSTAQTPSSTPSPWWVADPSTASSPWWVPESPATAVFPSSTTSSPWWVAETSTTPTSRPSTTSPWWVADASSSTTGSSSTTALPSLTTESPVATSSSAADPTATSTPWVAGTSTTGPHPATAFTPVATTSASPNSEGTCGRGPFQVLEWQRIIGGITSVKNAWPFAVSMMAKGRHFCGGSLVDQQHILTAAHCVATLSTHDVAGVEVILGLHTLKPMDAKVVRRKLVRVVRHKDYDSATFFNDIALLKMDWPVEFSDDISPVCLPSLGTVDLYVDQAATVVGWGALQEDGKLLPTSLQQVTVQVQTNAQCRKSYGSDAPGGIQDNMLCAANLNKDSCMGDSGGPLVVQSSPGAPWIQVGIVSWGIGCGRDTYPGVYVRTTSFIDWIKKNLN